MQIQTTKKNSFCLTVNFWGMEKKLYFERKKFNYLPYSPDFNSLPHNPDF